MYELLKDLPGIDKGNTVYLEDIGNMELYIKQISIGAKPGFMVWKSDGIDVNKLNDGLNMIISTTIDNNDWFKKLT